MLTATYYIKRYLFFLQASYQKKGKNFMIINMHKYMLQLLNRMIDKKESHECENNIGGFLQFMR